MGGIKHSFRVVVAIDFGTSRSGYAYAFTDDKRIIGRNDWPGQVSPYPKTLTHLLYHLPDKKVVAWGYNARQQLAQHRKSPEKAKDFELFLNFKMDLHSGIKTSNGPIIIKDGQDFVVVDLVSDYLKCMKELALEELRQSTAGNLRDDEILWCLTVPAIWTDAEKSLMRQAAQNARLFGSGNIEVEQLLLVLEPEAAAIYCQEKEKFQLSPGTRFMVVDCGGGTIDITVHEVIPKEGLKEIASGTGIAYGSTRIDEVFRDKILIPTLTSRVITKFHDEEPIEYLELMADWERIKCNFNPQTNEETYYFPIRLKLYKLLQKEHPHVLKQLAQKQNGEDVSINLSRATIETIIFGPVVDEIVQKIAEQFEGLGKQGCEIIFLVGGFSTSPVLQQRIKNVFKKRVKKIVIPPLPGAAIVEGAVSFGLNPSLIRSRRSRLTYVCSISTPFEFGIDPEGKKFWCEDKNAWYCRDKACVFVVAGDAVGADEKITKKFSPIKHDQESMIFNFYTTPKKQIRYIDEYGAKKIGEMVVDIPDITGGLDREVEMTIYFGKTEIKVEAQDLTSGKQCKTSFRFSYTYSSELIGICS